MAVSLYEDNRVKKFAFKKNVVENDLIVDEIWNHNGVDVHFKTMKDESQLPEFSGLLAAELSEPYTVFTYRYFWINCPRLSLLAYVDGKCVGVIIAKMEEHKGHGIFATKSSNIRGYIGMLAVDPSMRGKKIGSRLVEMVNELMWIAGADDIVLDAEATNTAALKLYTSLGFIKTKKLNKYYLSNSDAYRLKLVNPVHAMSEDDLLDKIHNDNEVTAAIENHLGNIGGRAMSFALPTKGGRLCTFTRAGHAAMENRLGRQVLVEGHSHDGKPCAGHGGEHAGHSHGGHSHGGHSHGGHSHTHDGKPCTGHGHQEQVRRPAPRPNHGHSHSHDGKPCSGH